MRAISAGVIAPPSPYSSIRAWLMTAISRVVTSPIASLSYMSRTSSRLDLRFMIGGWWLVADYQPPTTSHQAPLLCIRPLHTLYEYFIERGRDHLEPGDARAVGDQLPEQRLRIGAVLQDDLSIIAVGHELFDQWIIFERRFVILPVDRDVAPSEAALDFAHRAAEDFAPVVDQADFIAKLFGLFHEVGRK